MNNPVKTLNEFLDKENLLKVLCPLGDINDMTHFNERYIHHLFTYQIQQECPITLEECTLLHPEWATSVNDIRNGGRYKRGTENKYVIVDGEEGHSGFIDFAIGKAENPDYAIEFKMSTQFNREGLTYDYMKLLDCRNEIKSAISVAVYYGHSSHSSLCSETLLNECLNDAKNRLRKYLDSIREHRFIFVEVVKRGMITWLECTNDEFVKC